MTSSLKKEIRPPDFMLIRMLPNLHEIQGAMVRRHLGHALHIAVNVQNEVQREIEEEAHRGGFNAVLVQVWTSAFLSLRLPCVRAM